MLEVSAAVLDHRPTTVLCDLDGVVWLAHEPIRGSVEAVARLRRDLGCRVIFVTNNSAARIADQEAVLASIGIPAEGDVVTSAVAAAGLLRPGARVLVCGGPGVAEAVERAGGVVVDGDDTSRSPVDAVVVGFHRQFDYERMRIATAAVLDGARLIATNDDPTYPTPDGPIPGGGAIVASIAVASGVPPVVAGKPFAPMADAIARMLPGVPGHSLLMVGDRITTDGEFASAIGCPFALVRSGVTAPGDEVAVAAALDVADLAAVASAIGEVVAAGR